MEADDRGSLGDKDPELVIVGQEGLVDLGQARRRLRPEAGELGSEPGKPCRLPADICGGRLVAEHVDLERTLGPGPHYCKVRSF